MDNHSFSPTVTTATLKTHKPTKMDKHKGSHMESLTQGSNNKAHSYVPSSTRHTNSQLKMVEYEVSRMESLTQFHMKKNANVLTSNMMNHNSGSLNKSHQVQEKPHHKQMQKALQYMVKTSSDADANQDPDLAKAEGLNPREGITRHSALPVGTEFLRVLASCSNLIAAGQVIIVYLYVEFILSLLSDSTFKPNINSSI